MLYTLSPAIATKMSLMPVDSTWRMKLNRQLLNLPKSACALEAHVVPGEVAAEDAEDKHRDFFADVVPFVVEEGDAGEEIGPEDDEHNLGHGSASDRLHLREQQRYKDSDDEGEKSTAHENQSTGLNIGQQTYLVLEIDTVFFYGKADKVGEKGVDKVGAFVEGVELGNLAVDHLEAFV